MKMVLLILVGALVVGCRLERMDARGYALLLAVILAGVLLEYASF